MQEGTAMNRKSDRRAAIKLLTAAPLGLAMSAALASKAVAYAPGNSTDTRTAAGPLASGTGNSKTWQAAAPGHIRRVAAQAGADPSVINEWNATTVAIMADAGKSNAEGFLPIGFTAAAVYNAVMGVTGRYALYRSSARTEPTASAQAAAVAAAHRVLTTYFGDVPAAATRLADAYAASLAALPDGPATTAGLLVGKQAAERFIGLRVDDGRYGPNTFDMAPAPGVWRPTPPANAPFFGKWMCDCKPLMLESPSQFRPAPPPALTSAEYAADFEEVKAFGAKDGSARTPMQTETGLFISSIAMGPLQAALRDLAVRREMDISDRARMFAAVNMSVADAIIAGWDAKVHYGLWRPITAIRLADEDGNSATTPDPTWDSLIVNPAYPDYVSGGNVIIGSATRALTRVLGTDRIDLTFHSPVTNTTRYYEFAGPLCDDMVDARVWVGLHFRFADVAARVQGEQVADWAMDRYFMPA
jgi:hypothetical protein